MVKDEIKQWDKQIAEAVKNAYKHATAKSTLVEKEDAMPGKVWLSDFQAEKLRKLYKIWFDQDHNDVISAEDFELLNKKIHAYTGWSATSPEGKLLADVQRNFFDCLLNTAHPQDYLRTQKAITLDEWLDVWGTLSRGAMAMSYFPHYIQLLPQIMFLVIDRDMDGVVNKKELRNFYEKFVGIPAQDLDRLTDLAYKRMTGNGDFELTMELYEMVFANFILGKTLFGPGPFILGVFETTKNEPQCKIDMAIDDAPPFKHRKSHFLMSVAKHANEEAGEY